MHRSLYCTHLVALLRAAAVEMLHVGPQRAGGQPAVPDFPWQELAVMVARARSGEVAAFPVVETLHVDSILLATEAPARIPAALRDRARSVAERAVACLDGAPHAAAQVHVC